jgi:ribonuclease VapC
MNASRVLDSYSILAYLEDEPGADKVSDLIKRARDAEKPLLLSVVNWGEVYYIIRRETGKEAADSVMLALDTLPIELVNVERELAYAAAELKAAHKMSYADCFAAALAQTRKAELVTGDKEFKALEGIIKILWL